MRRATGFMVGSAFIIVASAGMLNFTSVTSSGSIPKSAERCGIVTARGGMAFVTRLLKEGRRCLSREAVGDTDGHCGVVHGADTRYLKARERVFDHYIRTKIEAKCDDEDVQLLVLYKDCASASSLSDLVRCTTSGMSRVADDTFAILYPKRGVLSEAASDCRDRFSKAARKYTQRASRIERACASGGRCGSTVRSEERLRSRIISTCPDADVYDAGICGTSSAAGAGDCAVSEIDNLVREVVGFVY